MVRLKVIENLKLLLKSIEPKLMPGRYVYCKVDNLSELHETPLMLFKEDEAITLVIKKSQADSLELDYAEIWELVTLSVHSSLTAVGFIATVTQHIAKHGISTNVISAYYHDHLLVPFGKGCEVVKLLKELQESFD